MSMPPQRPDWFDYLCKRQRKRIRQHFRDTATAKARQQPDGTLTVDTRGLQQGTGISKDWRRGMGRKASMTEL